MSSERLAEPKYQIPITNYSRERRAAPRGRTRGKLRPVASLGEGDLSWFVVGFSRRWGCRGKGESFVRSAGTQATGKTDVAKTNHGWTGQSLRRSPANGGTRPLDGMIGSPRTRTRPEAPFHRSPGKPPDDCFGRGAARRCPQAATNAAPTRKSGVGVPRDGTRFGQCTGVGKRRPYGGSPANPSDAG